MKKIRQQSAIIFIIEFKWFRLWFKKYSYYLVAAINIFFIAIIRNVRKAYNSWIVHDSFEINFNLIYLLSSLNLLS
jgi:hypothetical protein